MKNRIGIFSLFLISCCSVFGQEFSIKKIEITSDNVVVHYDLIDTTRYRTYTVRVYSSVDKFLAPLEKINGDAGLEVVPGKNKKIVWSAKEELGTSFIGNVELEVRGRVYIPFIRLVGFENVGEFKRTVPRLVKWTGGNAQNVISFQLYDRNHKLVHSFANAPNELQYNVNIPKSIKPGKGYYFKVSDSKNTDQVVISPTFSIKPKYPLALKAVPLVVVGGGVYFIVQALSNKNNDLDGPPAIPENP